MASEPLSTTSSAQSPGAAPSGWTLALLCLGQLIVVLDLSIVNVALPAIQADLDFSAAGLPWVINGYAIAFAGFLLLGGRVADLIGRRRVFVAGLVLFTVASLSAGFAQSPEWLIAARIAQGFGGALLSPATLAILTTAFPQGRARARATAAWGAVSGAGAALGSVLGGVLTDVADWRWVFFVNVPLGLIALAAAHPLLVESRGEDRRLDGIGALLITGTLVGVVVGTTDAQQYGWSAFATWGPLAGAVVLLVLFVLHESRSARPLIPLYVLRVRSVAWSNIAIFWLGAAVIAHFFFLSLYMQNTLHMNALLTGLAFLPGAAAMTVGAYAGPALVKKTGRAVTLLWIGAALTTVGLLILTRLPADGSYWLHLLPAQLLVTLGAGLLTVPLVIAGTSGIEPGEAGVASGIINTTRQFGGAVGLAVLATIAASHAGGNDLDSQAALSGYRWAFGVGAIFAALALLSTLMLSTGARPSRRRPVVGPDETAPQTS